MEKLTELKIKNLKPGETEKYVRERNGFILRIRPAGSKSFYFVYDFESKRHRLHLGSWPSVSLAEAREKHLQAMLLLKQGIAPHQINKLSTSGNPVTVTQNLPATIGAICNDYLAWSERHHATSWHNIVATTIRVHLQNPDVVNLPASDFKRRDALQMLDGIAVDRPGMARTLLRVARGVFGLAVEMETIEVNPFAGLKLARTIPSVVPKSRERVLADDEIRHVWQVLTDPYRPPGADSTRRALLLILITGQRPGECAGMMYEEVKDNWWTIPAERVKNRKTHRLWLSPLALEVVGAGQKGPVFPGPKGGKTTKTAALSHLVAEGDCKSRQPFFGLPRWTPHDLRRTMSTGLASLGCPDEVNDALLNHTKKGIIATYNRHHYDNKKAEWLLRWSEHLQKLIQG